MYGSIKLYGEVKESKIMRKENSIWNNVPNGWYICGGMIIPPNFKYLISK